MKGVFFIGVPKKNADLEKCRKWVNAFHRADFSINNVSKDTYICSKHFVGGNGPTEDHLNPIPANYN